MKQDLMIMVVVAFLFGFFFKQISGSVCGGGVVEGLQTPPASDSDPVNVCPRGMMCPEALNGNCPKNNDCIMNPAVHMPPCDQTWMGPEHANKCCYCGNAGSGKACTCNVDATTIKQYMENGIYSSCDCSGALAGTKPNPFSETDANKLRDASFDCTTTGGREKDQGCP